MEKGEVERRLTCNAPRYPKTCVACSHTALLTPAFLARLGSDTRHRVLDLKDRVRCRGCDVRGRAVVSIRWERVPRR